MALRTLSTAALRRELARREAGANRVAKRRDKLAKRLAALDAELADLGVDGAPRRGRPPGQKAGRRGPGRPKGSKNRRAKNSMSLLEAIVKGVRAGSTVSPMQAAAAAKKAGYKSSSPNLGMMVANQLAKAPMFKRVGRGQYLHKGGAAKAGTPARRERKALKRGRKAGRPKGRKLRAKVPTPPRPEAASA